MNQEPVDLPDQVGELHRLRAPCVVVRLMVGSAVGGSETLPTLEVLKD